MLTIIWLNFDIDKIEFMLITCLNLKHRYTYDV